MAFGTYTITWDLEKYGTSSADSLTEVIVGSNPTFVYNYVYGGSGNDTMTSSLTLQLQPFVDWGQVGDLSQIKVHFFGEEGNDVLTGDGRTDYLDGGKGNDTIIGGDGDDFLYDEDGRNVIDGGNGFDVVTLSGDQTKTKLSNVEQLTLGGAVVIDFTTLTSFTEIKNSKDYCYLLLNGSGVLKPTLNGDVAYEISLDDGANTFNLAYFNADLKFDAFSVNSGKQTINTGAGNDTFSYFGGEVSISSGKGDDTFESFRDIVGTVDGGDGNDVIEIKDDTTGLEAKNIEELRVRDYVTAKADFLNSFATVSTDQASIEITLAEAGSVHLKLLDGVQGAFFGSSGNDLIDLSAATEGWSIVGGLGGDTIQGGHADDTIFGGDGEDIVVLSGLATDYTIVESEKGTWVVTDKRTSADSGGVDTLKEVESIQFSDGSVMDISPNTAPTNIKLSKTSIAENVPLDTALGVLTASDAEGDPLTWTMSKNNFFALKTSNGVTSLVVTRALDYETAKSHTVNVTVSDGEYSVSSEIKINVKDVIDKITGTDFADIRVGGVGADVIDGRGGNDQLRGQAGNDKILGSSGNDKLWGDAGDDILIGGLGKDQMYGGTGSDDFQFALGDSGKTKTTADVILDFGKTDDIDLSLIDANTKTLRNDSFSFLGTSAFSKHAGELRYERKDDVSWVSGDTNGDGKADFMIEVHYSGKLTSQMFDL